MGTSVVPATLIPSQGIFLKIKNCLRSHLIHFFKTSAAPLKFKIDLIFAYSFRYLLHSRHKTSTIRGTVPLNYQSEYKNLLVEKHNCQQFSFFVNILIHNQEKKKTTIKKG